MGKSDDAVLALTDAFFRSAAGNGRKQLSEKEWTNSLNVFYRKADEIRHRYSLGFLGRAIVAYRFQKRLLAAGFEADTVRKVVFSLVLSSFSSST